MALPATPSEIIHRGLRTALFRISWKLRSRSPDLQNRRRGFGGPPRLKVGLRGETRGRGERSRDKAMGRCYEIEMALEIARDGAGIDIDGASESRAAHGILGMQGPGAGNSTSADGTRHSALGTLTPVGLAQLRRVCPPPQNRTRRFNPTQCFIAASKVRT